MSNSALETKVDELRKELDDIEMNVLTKGYTLADAIREGCTNTDQLSGWNNKDYSMVCALGAAYLAAKARGVVK